MECTKCENLYCNDCAIEWTKKNNSYFIFYKYKDVLINVMEILN